MNVIEEYVSEFSQQEQEKMRELWAIIKEFAPEATEKISWSMPTFYLKGNLVHFAMHKKHIGFYPGDTGVAAFEARLEDYKHSKGAIQFPLEAPLPHELIADIVKFRVKENEQAK